MFSPFFGRFQPPASVLKRLRRVDSYMETTSLWSLLEAGLEGLILKEDGGVDGGHALL